MEEERAKSLERKVECLMQGGHVWKNQQGPGVAEPYNYCFYQPLLNETRMEVERKCARCGYKETFYIKSKNIARLKKLLRL